jgi:hypothetical protein
MSDLIWKYISSCIKKKFFFAEIFTEIILISSFKSYNKLVFNSLKKKNLINLILSPQYNSFKLFTNRRKDLKNLRGINFFNDIFKLIIQKFIFIFTSSLPFLLKLNSDFDYLFICNIINFLKVENKSIRYCGLIFYGFFIHSNTSFIMYKNSYKSRGKLSDKIKRLLVLNSCKEISIFSAINLKKMKSENDITGKISLLNKKNKFYSYLVKTNMLFMLKKMIKSLKIHHLKKKLFRFNFFKKVFILTYVKNHKTLLFESSWNNLVQKKKILSILKNKKNMKIFGEIFFSISNDLIVWFLQISLRNCFNVFFFIKVFFFPYNFYKKTFFEFKKFTFKPFFCFNFFIKIFGVIELFLDTSVDLIFHFKIKEFLEMILLKKKNIIKFTKRVNYLETFLYKFFASLFFASNMVYKKINPIFRIYGRQLVFRVLVFKKKNYFNSENRLFFNKLTNGFSDFKFSKLLKKVPIQFSIDFYINFLNLFTFSNLKFQKIFNYDNLISRNEFLKSFVNLVFLTSKKLIQPELTILMLNFWIRSYKSYQISSFFHLLSIEKISKRSSKKNNLIRLIRINFYLNLFYKTQKISLKVNIISEKNFVLGFKKKTENPLFLLFNLSLGFQVIKKRSCNTLDKYLLQTIKIHRFIQFGNLFFGDLVYKIKPSFLGNRIKILVKYFKKFKNMNLDKRFILRLQKNMYSIDNLRNNEMMEILIKNQLNGEVLEQKNKIIAIKEKKNLNRPKNIFVKKFKSEKFFLFFYRQKLIFCRKNDNVLDLIIKLPFKTTIDLIRF